MRAAIPRWSVWRVVLLGLLPGILAGPRLSAGEIAGEWKTKLTAYSPPTAVPLRPFEGEFEFGWSGVPAGRASFRLLVPQNNRFEVEADGGTTGFAASLWRLNATYTARGRLPELTSISFQQREKYRGHRIELDAEFTKDGARRKRQRIPSPDINTWRMYRVPGMRDLAATMLYIRGQRLREGDAFVTLCFPGDSPYLVETTVGKPRKIFFREKDVSCITLHLRLLRLETRGPKKGTLEPHKRFRSATVYLSDDDWRLPLKAEVGVFIGTVYGELLSWRPLP